MLPGKANGVPVPNITRMHDDKNARASPYHGPRMTTLSTFTKCCTGAALIVPNGMTITVLNTTLTAIKRAVSVSLRVFKLITLRQS